MVPAALERSRVIGVDVGGTKILAAVMTPHGAIEARVERPTVVSSQEELLGELDGAVEELRAGHGDITALGFGIPSRIDQRTGRAVASVNIPLADLDFRDRMRERHGLPVAIDNDANAATIAEWKVGAARGANQVVMLTLGTGVGGGLILDGRPFRGATGSGAELGHIVVDFDGPLCACGGRGHLEAVASGKAASRAAQELYGAEADAHELVRRAESGDDKAVEAMAKIGRYLGAGLATFVNIFEPELIVIGGGFGRESELLLGAAREVLARDGLAPGSETVRIVEAQLGAEAGVIGAGMIAFEALDSGS
jgi:glucokinase